MPRVAQALSAVQPPSLQGLQGLRMEKAAAERGGKAGKQWTPCKCELERALLSFLLVVRCTSCQSHSSWEKAAEELFLHQLGKQTGRAEGCIATDWETRIWSHWNKVEQSQRAIVKDTDFRQLCSVVTWMMLKTGFCYCCNGIVGFWQTCLSTSCFFFLRAFFQ